MITKQFLLPSVAAALLSVCAMTAAAAPITVLPSQVVGTATANTWYRASTVSGGTANVTSTYSPPGETGSLQFGGTLNASKADVRLTWGATVNASITTAVSQNRTLGNLTEFGFDWLRAGGTSAGHFAPTLRLFYDADGLTNTTNDRGTLVWEPIYNGVTVVAGSWTSTDVLGGKFWEVNASGQNIDLYNYTLADWMALASNPTDGDGQIGRALNANTVIYGLGVSIGSGWGGTFQGAVDDIRIGFGGSTTSWNFETQAVAVPEPGSLALAGLALAAVGVVSRRVRRRAA